MALSVGQLFMLGFSGTTLPEQLRDFLRDGDLAGVILFRRNIKSVAQLQELTASIREAAGRPIIIGVDHEGGRVFRMPEPFTKVPPLAQLADIAREGAGAALFEGLAAMMGRELAAVGVNCNFAPVLDVNTNQLNPIIGDRAFSTRCDEVAEYGCAFIRGLQSAGVIACGKHFPGHGDTAVDSHLGLPNVPHTMERLHFLELVPFVRAIAAQVPMLMTAHVVYSGIDAMWPATLSRTLIHGLLRRELGFEGVIATDDLEMGAIHAFTTPVDAALRSLSAGCDLALMCHDLKLAEQAMRRVEQAARDGEVSTQQLEDSAARIQALALRSITPAVDANCIGSPEHRRIGSGSQS